MFQLEPTQLPHWLLRELEQSGLDFADEDGVKTRSEIFANMIGRVMTVRGNRDAAATGYGRHPEGELTIPEQAHLGQEVEIVFANYDQARPVPLQSSSEAFFGSI